MQHTSPASNVPEDEGTLQALRSMIAQQLAVGNYSKSLALVRLLLQKNMQDCGGVDLLARMATITGNAIPLQAHLDALIRRGRLGSHILNVVLRRVVIDDPNMVAFARQAGLPMENIVDWIAQRAESGRDLSVADTKLLKGLMMSSIGRILRRVFPIFEPVCAEFPGANLVVLSDGTVTTCCADCAGANVFSSLKSKSLQQVWEQDLPSVLHRGLYEMPLCNGCIGTTKAPLRADVMKRDSWLVTPQNHIDSLTIEMMGSCNYGCCIGSSVAKYRSVNTDLGMIFQAIAGMLPSVRRLRLFNYGEPLLNKRFTWFIEQCRKVAPDIHMVTSTNGMLLNERIARGMIEHGLNHVVVSVHGGPGTDNMLRYSKYGADYGKVLNNLARLVELREIVGARYPTVGLRAILFHWNDTDECLDRLRCDAAALGLEAHWGHYSVNNYHWIHDGNGLGDRASARFRPGSESWRQLLECREFFMPRKFEEEQSRLGAESN